MAAPHNNASDRLPGLPFSFERACQTDRKQALSQAQGATREEVQLRVQSVVSTARAKQAIIALMTDSAITTLQELRQAGYFDNTEENQLAEMARTYGLEAALFSPVSGRAVLLDAEDLADGGAGIAIQQIRVLLASRGMAFDAADSEHHDESGDRILLEVDGKDATLMDWSFSKRPLPGDIAAMGHETALADLLWKSRVQGIDLEVRPCEHGGTGVDLHVKLAQGTRPLAHWGRGFDDGRVLYAVNFFTIVNRLLAQFEAAERLYAWQPFTSGQTGVLLDEAWHARLQALGLTAQLRRIDAGG